MRRYVFSLAVVAGLAFVPPRLHGSWTDPLPDALRTDAPPAARQFWRELVACTGIRPQRGRGFGSITWYRVHGRQFTRPDNGRSVIGLWIRPGNAVVLSSAWYEDERLIKHEMLHVLLQRGSHDDPHFQAAGGMECGLYPS